MSASSRYAPPATAEPPNSSSRVRTRPLAHRARTTSETASTQQPTDGPRDTVRATVPNPDIRCAFRRSAPKALREALGLPSQNVEDPRPDPN
ncbi:hypothetical protein TPA0906_26560 [Streptomyces olivaceus]|nr:hypothetical protein TPA0906_26560 [Streptomyces olivaceus]